MEQCYFSNLAHELYSQIFAPKSPGSSPSRGGKTVALFPNLSHLNLLFSTISVALFRQKIIHRLNRTFVPSPRQENGPAERAPWLSVLQWLYILHLAYFQ
jgi:hypothetical protein